MREMLRLFGRIARIELKPFLHLRVDPPSYVPVQRPEWASGPVVDPRAVVDLNAVVGQRAGRTNIVPPEVFSNFCSARFEVYRVIAPPASAMPTYTPVANSGTQEMQPATWSWSPRSAGTYRLRATSVGSEDTLMAELEPYQVPLRVKLDVTQRAGGLRATAEVFHAVPGAEVAGLAIKFGYAALRTDIPGQQAVWRSHTDPADADPSWQRDLDPGTYTILCFVGQFSDATGYVAWGDQVVMGFQVT
jgi:hypothetical protein